MTAIELPRDATPDDVVDLRARLTAVRHAFAKTTRPVRPSIVITPAGLPHLAAIERRLVELEIRVARRDELPDWARLSSALQVTWDDEAGLAKAWAFEQLWRHLFPADRCLIVELASMADFTRFWIEKLGMREELGAQLVTGQTPRLAFRAKVHPFHSADPGRLAVESAWLDQLIDR